MVFGVGVEFYEDHPSLLVGGVELAVRARLDEEHRGKARPGVEGGGEKQRQ